MRTLYQRLIFSLFVQPQTQCCFISPVEHFVVYPNWSHFYSIRCGKARQTNLHRVVFWNDLIRATAERPCRIKATICIEFIVFPICPPVFLVFFFVSTNEATSEWLEFESHNDPQKLH